MNNHTFQLFSLNKKKDRVNGLTLGYYIDLTNESL